MKPFFNAILIFAILYLLSGCKNGYEDKFGPFYIENDTTIFMDGDMGNKVDNQFDKLLEQYPDIRLVVFGICPGSKDDVAMIEAATQLRNRGINTHLTTTSIIESGAVDFYLAGNTRTLENGSLIGVHAWSEGKDAATDFPKGDPVHDLYIDYYIFCGYSPEEAEEFYFFTINAAPPDDIHYMTAEEIEKYQIVTE